MKTLETLKQQAYDYELILKMLNELRARDAKLREKINSAILATCECEYGEDADKFLREALLLLEGKTE